MGSHFECVGFNEVETEAGTEALAKTVYLKGQCLDAPMGLGHYRCWTPGEGICLWLATDANNEAVSLIPGWLGSQMQGVRIKLAHPEKDSPLEGRLHVACQPDAGKPPPSGAQKGSYSFCFDVPDFACQAGGVSAGEVRRAQVSAFAYQARVFYKIEEFERYEAEFVRQQARAAGSAGKPMPVEGFFAGGLFAGLVGHDLDLATADATLTGRILEGKMIKNPKTGFSFYHLIVRTRDQQLDLLVDEASLTNKPARGAVIKADVWLTGRIPDLTPAIEPPKEAPLEATEPSVPKLGLFKKLFSRKKT